MQDPLEVVVGRANVKYGGVDLGFTEGEVVITYTPTYRLFEPDQNTAPVKAFLTNEALKVTIPLAQSKVKSLGLAKAWAAGALVGKPEAAGGDTTLDADVAAGAAALSVVAEATFSDADFVQVGSGANAEIIQIGVPAPGTLPVAASTPLQFDHLSGEAVVELELPVKRKIKLGNDVNNIPAAQLVIEPVGGDTTNKWTIHKALVVDEVALSLQKTEETVVEVAYTALADTSRAVGDQLASYGDDAVT